MRSQSIERSFQFERYVVECVKDRYMVWIRMSWKWRKEGKLDGILQGGQDDETAIWPRQIVVKKLFHLPTYDDSEPDTSDQGNQVHIFKPRDKQVRCSVLHARFFGRFPILSSPGISGCVRQGGHTTNISSTTTRRVSTQLKYDVARNRSASFPVRVYSKYFNTTKVVQTPYGYFKDCCTRNPATKDQMSNLLLSTRDCHVPR